MFADSLGRAWARTNTAVWAFILISVLCSSCRQKPAIRPTPQMHIAQRFWIRVLLLDDITDCTLQVPASFAVASGRYDADRVYFQKTAGPVKISVSNSRIVVAGQTFDGTQITILPDNPYIFKLNQKNYRGNLRLIRNGNGSSFDVINLVPLEAYLAGVVGAEMPNYWEPEALNAQAIAARTYCLYIKKRFGAKRPWDVRSTQANQVYLGINAESPQVWNAVEKTAGRVLLCRHNHSDELFPTYYSAICAGHTENSKNVFGDSFPPLVGVPCPYCKNVAKTNLFFWPMVQFDKTLVNSRILQRYPSLKNLGRIVSVVPARQSAYSLLLRLTSVKLTGSSGKTGFLRAEDLRLTIDPTGKKIKSTSCQISDFGDKWAFVAGRGYGHGVGMCQSGAQGMARVGETAEKILYYYYPNSKITMIY